MQNTRLNTLIETTGGQLSQVLRNPWRRLAVLLISLSLGNLLGNVISTTTGQRASLDVVVAAILVVVLEISNRLLYGSRPENRRLLPYEMANALKIGVTFSLFLDALKLGS